MQYLFYIMLLYHTALHYICWYCMQLYHTGCYLSLCIYIYIYTYTYICIYIYTASGEHLAAPERAARERAQDAVLDATAAGVLQDEAQERRKPVRHVDLIKENTQ
jgi:hypothetical protein